MRGYLNKHRYSGIAFEFALDEPLEVEIGTVCRTVAFSFRRPAVPAGDIAAFNTSLNL